MKDVTPAQLKAAEADWQKANPGKVPTSDDISSQAYQTFYNQAFTESGFGIGGKVQQVIQATNAAQEATGDILAGIILPGKKVPHVPNAGAVGNMAEFLKQSGFGSEIKELSKKTSKQYQGQAVYKADKSVGDYIKKGDQFYLDAKHKDHIEVFDSTGTKVRAVLNLDGSFNDAKTKTARAEGRRLPK